MSTLIYYVAAILAAVCVFTPHEFAHAFVAYKNGDPTAKYNGRMTLNPLKHFDIVGFLMIVFVGFGWAKPVPINSDNFRHYRRGLFTTAIAGICTNYIIAFIVYPLYLLVYLYMARTTFLYTFFYYFFRITFTYSLCCVIFNILPLYPLDGFRIVESLTRPYNRARRFLRNYGQIILIVLVAESFLCNILSSFNITWADKINVLNYVMNFATEIIGLPIKALWNVVYGKSWNWNWSLSYLIGRYLSW